MHVSKQDALDTAEAADERNARRPNPIDAHVGTRVKMRRMLLGMSQEKLGELLGLTFQQVQKYEKGVNRIGASRLFDLAHVLGVSIQYFYDELPAATAEAHTGAVPGMAEECGQTYIGEVMTSREGVELSKAFSRIEDPHVRRAVVELVKAISNQPASER